MLNNNREKIKWLPRIRPELIKRLYDADALGVTHGIQDTDLCEDVAFRLYLRCQSILMVFDNQVACPRCMTVFVVQTSDRENTCPTEGCGWYTTMGEYHQSWSKKRIWAANAFPAFEEYYNRYPKTSTYKEKMLLIDQLIHKFHWDLKSNLPSRTVGNNLIEGSHDQVVAFLDNLSGIDPDKKST